MDCGVPTACSHDSTRSPGTPSRSHRPRIGGIEDPDGAFTEWLRKHLASERASLIQHLQSRLEKQLGEHHGALSRDLEGVMPLHQELLGSRRKSATSGSVELRSAWHIARSRTAEASDAMWVAGDVNRTDTEKSTKSTDRWGIAKEKAAFPLAMGIEERKQREVPVVRPAQVAGGGAGGRLGQGALGSSAEAVGAEVPKHREELLSRPVQGSVEWNSVEPKRHSAADPYFLAATAAAKAAAAVARSRCTRQGSQVRFSSKDSSRYPSKETPSKETSSRETGYDLATELKASEESPTHGGSVVTVKSNNTSGTTSSKHYQTRKMKKLAYGTTFFLMSSGEGLSGNWVSRFVHSWVFEAICSTLILLNTVVMAAEVQFVGQHIGHKLGHEGYSRPPQEYLPGGGTVLDLLLMAFLVAFFAEFAFRAIDKRLRSFTSAWMWFDAFILFISVVDVVGRFQITAKIFDMNPSAMRMARLCRMLRMMKILKTKEGFEALFLLIKSIQASAHALLWSCLLMVFVMLIAGLLINQLLLGYLNDESLPVAERLEVFNLFGTYTRMYITMFEFTLGNWAPPQRVLMQNVTEYWGLFVVTYRAVFCFALVNISAAVFNSETSRAAAADDEVAMMNRERARLRDLRKVEALFDELDTTGDGRVTWEEFQELINDRVMKTFLGTLNVEVEDVRELFRLLDSGDGSVFHEDFVRGMQSMKGQAKSLDLLILTKLARTMELKLDKLTAKAGVYLPPSRRTSTKS